MNSQGHHKCHVALLYPKEEQWAAGYSGNISSTGYTKIQEALLFNQFDYDIISPDVLLQAEIGDGKISIQKEEYDLLLLPPMKVMSVELAQKLNQYFCEGGKIVSMTELPSQSVHGKDKELIQLLNEIFEKSGTKKNDNEVGKKGASFFVSDVNSVIDIISKNTSHEIEVISGAKNALRFHQRQNKNEVQYLVLNESTTPNSFELSFPNYGQPYKLNIETGEIEKVSNFLMKEGRIYFSFTFQPREAFYLVFKPEKIEPRDILIGETTLSSAEVISINGSNILTGWGNASKKQFAQIIYPDNSRKAIELNSQNSPDPVYLSPNWNFMAFNTEFKERWTDQVSCDTIDIPVMKFYTNYNHIPDEYSNPGYDDTFWPTVKIYDKFSKEQGGARYFSTWNSSRIVYFDRSRHLQPLGGNDVEFRKNFRITAKPLSAKIKLTAEPLYELVINGETVIADTVFQTAEQVDISSFMKVGDNQIIVKVPQHKGLILEGDVITSLEVVHLNTNDSWEVKDNSKNQWTSAFIHSRPPLGGWNRIEIAPDFNFPVDCWYRQTLPVCTAELLIPMDTGSFEYYLNGKNILPENGKIYIPNNMIGRTNYLAIKTTFHKNTDGLKFPIKAVLHPVNVDLADWSEYGLSWFSGRGIYTQKVQLDKNYFNKGLKLMLNLGKLNWFAEVWINHQLVKFFPWGEFSIDVTKYVTTGENEISVIVSNLTANKEYWDVPDAVLDRASSRWWHNGATDREKDKLQSGLFGPIQIVPFTFFEKIIVE